MAAAKSKAIPRAESAIASKRHYLPIAEQSREKLKECSLIKVKRF